MFVAASACAGCAEPDVHPPFAGDFELVAINGGPLPRPEVYQDTVYSDTLTITRRDRESYTFLHRTTQWNSTAGRFRYVDSLLYFYSDETRQTLRWLCTPLTLGAGTAAWCPVHYANLSENTDSLRILDPANDAVFLYKRLP